MKFEALRRLPKLPQRELFAYQSADKLLLETIKQADIQGPFLVYDDHFGALVAGLIDLGIEANSIYWVNESRCSHDSMHLNVTQELAGSHYDLQQCLDEIPLDKLSHLSILSRWSKSKEQWTYFTQQVHHKLISFNIHIDFYSSGMVKYYFPELRSELEHLAPSNLSRIHKKARVLSSSFHTQELKQPDLNFKWDRLQFNQGKPDQASQLLANELPGLSKVHFDPIKTSQEESDIFRILDLGAGSGSLGIHAALSTLKSTSSQTIELDLIEDNWFSIQALTNDPQIVELRSQGVLVNILHSNIFRLKPVENKTWDWIISNPPYHQFNTLTPSLAHEFLIQSYHRLNEKACLTWVTSSSFKIPGKLSSNMNVKKLVSKSGHSIYHAEMNAY